MFQYTNAFVTIAAVDLQLMINFYTNLLSAPAFQTHNYAEFQLPGLRLGIFKPKAGNQSQFEAVKSGMSLCLEVDNLESAIAHLSALGYPPPGQIFTASHGREIYAYDPAGNRIILHQSA